MIVVTKFFGREKKGVSVASPDVERVSAYDLLGKDGIRAILDRFEFLGSCRASSLTGPTLGEHDVTKVLRSLEGIGLVRREDDDFVNDWFLTEGGRVVLGLLRQLDTALQQAHDEAQARGMVRAMSPAVKTLVAQMLRDDRVVNQIEMVQPSLTDPTEA